MTISPVYNTPAQSSPGRSAKVVCVGRNYADHARELNNPVPEEPLLFIKPGSCVVDMHEPLNLPKGLGSVHIETEMALLIGAPLSQADEGRCLEAIAGVGIGFDLTLRDLQNELKQRAHPWEKAKAFDGSCPLSEFIVPPVDLNWAAITIELQRNGELQQRGNSADMITPVAPLLSYISRFFTLLPGDVVLTGTPAGVGPIQSGDQLNASLKDLLSVTTRVA